MFVPHDLSNELRIHKFKQGLKLTRPDRLSNINDLCFDMQLSDFLQQPLSIWFCDVNCAVITANELCANFCGMDSSITLRGKTAHDFLRSDRAKMAIKHDIEVMKSEKLGVINFEFIRQDDFYLQSLNFKWPLYDESEQLIGSVGIGLDMNDSNLTESMQKLMNHNWAHMKNDFMQTNKINLSKREVECLKLSIKGRSAKQVGLILNISQRTVEEYLNNIKIKLKVTSKTELVGRAVELLSGSF